MIVSFGDKKIAKISDPKECTKNYGLSMKKIIHRRLNELHAAPSLETMRGVGDCHELQGNMKGCFAVDLQGPYRMVFQPANSNPPYTENNMVVWGKITEVEVIDIIDYH